MTPREIFERMRQQFVGEGGSLGGDLLADDVVVETPFAPPGAPARIVGKQQWLDFVALRRAAVPVIIEAGRTLAVHETTDPATIVVEYELDGVSTVTGRRATSAFIGVLTVRDDRVVLWREYQNTLAIQQALAA